MKKWFSENWDELVVYAFTVMGAIWSMIYASNQAGKAFHLDLFWTVLALMVSMVAVRLAETRGMAAAQRLGMIETAKAGRRRNLWWPRIPLGFGFGFVIQSSLPQILEALTKSVPGMIQSILLGA